ncbi:hypothetical protein BE20_15340 [Sorangium cellulosum]|nr:hypothetical protein BE20_15340 [Sorangium cellulosum]
MTDREGQLLERLREVTLALRKTLNERDTLELEKTEPIAIVGIGCRFPGGASTPEAFWELLDDGRDAIRPLEGRWSLVGVDPGDDVPRWAGLLTEAIDGFDAAFFGIAPREARACCWRSPGRGSKTPASRPGPSSGAAPACSSASAPRSISTPPSRTSRAKSGTRTADTACSSSLVAIHLACRSLRARESDLALAGGVNMLLSPDTMRALARTQALSPNGRCQTFDATGSSVGRAAV